jgi:hypothetical protein
VPRRGDRIGAEYPPPRILKGEPPHTGIDIVGTRLISFGRGLGDVQREHGDESG